MIWFIKDFPPETEDMVGVSRTLRVKPNVSYKKPL